MTNIVGQGVKLLNLMSIVRKTVTYQTKDGGGGGSSKANKGKALRVQPRETPDQRGLLW